ncbi:beta-ketoacyl-acyl-carrier-protein synthase i [Leptolyngbya sp. Heron Island J]|uniref:beta-ketoacyl-ACP synthase n=1 Tax=Leptolyngbya sp. Heron Island J TaxID=1385935 RepID=UPI0003B956E0|nr:beta-ketoacyl-ACP synthase [Leptolyngbya sp. Heron Island J]ESA34225.1 beta-ketoacyl-acyl-carrier-protein synthase i [Leptolyngbya sp. Heron Island J]
MLEVVVTGIGLWTALGPTVQSTWSNLLAGKSAIALRQPFRLLPAMPLAIAGKYPADPEPLLLATVRAAVLDAGLPPPLKDCGIVVGSSRSYLNRWEAMARGEQPLDRWITALPCGLSTQVAQALGSEGPVLAPMAACATGLWALFQGYMLLQTGQCRRVVVAAVDAPITPLTLTGFRRMGAMAKQGCYPFDRDRTGLVLGEGAAAVVLEVQDRASGQCSYGQLLGFGLSNDAYHISSSRPDGTLAVANQCLQRSGLHPDDIDYVHTHGTGTRLNDANEAHMIEQLFPKAAVSSTKGATGHTLGAAGLIGTVFSLLSLQHQRFPPCVGLSKPEFDLNFVRVGSSVNTAVKHVLCSSFGFGGQNAIVAIAR